MFNKELYDKYDLAGKQLLFKILEPRGFELVDGFVERFKDCDIVVKNTDSGQKTKWDVEVKNSIQFEKVWSGEYKDIILNQHRGSTNAKHFVIFSSAYDKMILLKMEDIRIAPTRFLTTSRGKEKFYTVDRKLGNYFEITYDQENNPQVRKVNII